MKRSIRNTENQLKYLIPYINKNISLSRKNWALVGGYVRDSLISSILKRKIDSPDIDIAVLGNFPRIELNNEIIKINKNTFGGLKIYSRKYGEIDLWKVDYGEQKEDIVRIWEDYLYKIDFGINSIIFIYPDQKIMLHKNWSKWFENRTISKLYELSKYSDIQLIRAFALSVNLSKKTGVEFHTSKKIKDELNYFLGLHNKDVYDSIMNYTIEKIRRKRWSYCVLRELEELKIKKVIAQ